MNSFGLTPGALLDDFGGPIGHACQREHGAARYRTDGVIGEHARERGCAVLGGPGDVAGLAHERLAHHVDARDDQATEMMARCIDAVDLHRRARVDHAQRRARSGPGADQGEPTVGAEQLRIEIAVHQAVILGHRGDELDVHVKRLLGEPGQSLRHLGAGDVRHQYPRGSLARVEQGRRPHSRLRITMHDGLLIGQAGARQPSPFQAGVAHVDDQNHEGPACSRCRRRPR